MKSISIVNKIISKKLDVPHSVVEKVNSFYWKASRDKLMKCEVTTIFWKHIGSVTISKYKVYKEIKRLIAKIRRTKTLEKYSEEAKEKVITEAKKRLSLLLVHRNNLAKDEYDKRISAVDSEGLEDEEFDNESDIHEDQMEDETTEQ